MWVQIVDTVQENHDGIIIHDDLIIHDFIS